MAAEPVPANTPESLGVTPRFVLQPNAISRSIHNLSVTAKKLAAMAMALLPADLSSLTASFTFTDFCKAIGYGDGGKQYELFRGAVRECLKCIISLETAPDKKGKKRWKEFTWFTVAEYDEATGQATMTFSAELAAVLLELKRLYAKINLQDMGKLQSRYAIRLFEMAKSYEWLAGKDGNPSGAFYFERNVSDFRELLGVAKESYKETNDFKKYAIEKPIKEINEAGIGLELAAESIKQGRRVAGIRVNGKKTARTVPAKRGRRKKTENPSQLELSDLTSQSVMDREDKELEHLKELYPDEFAGLYQEELGKLKPIGAGESFRTAAAEHSALEILRDKHGIVK